MTDKQDEAAKKTADSIIQIICGKSRPARFPRVRELTAEEERVARIMKEAGRGPVRS
jgi:hypothetical protein